MCLHGAALWLAAAALSADARASYRQGLEELERGAWQAAAESLREAIAERPEESVGAFRSYLPHYYLGLALSEAGDCQGALAAWSESERQGEVSETPLIHELTANRVRCHELQAEVTGAEGEGPDPVAAAAQATAERLREARELIAETSYLEPFPPRLGESLRLVEELTTALESADPADAAGRTALERRLDAALEELRETAAGPPPLLRAAAEAYLGGAYAEVETLLAGEPLEAPRVAAHARLLRAASHWALWALDGKRDDELLAAARQDVAACRALDPDLEPPPGVYPPAFLAFFAEPLGDRPENAPRAASPNADP